MPDGRKYVTDDEIRSARQVDLLSYLQHSEPHELVPEGNGYHSRSHDSLKISNGLWYWFSRGVGGRSALDFLIHVRGMDFIDAVQALCTDRYILSPEQPAPSLKSEKPAKEFVFPEPSADSCAAVRYLRKRGIDKEIISHCLDHGLIYESLPHHNAVFTGKDREGTVRYAMQRATDSSAWKLEASGSDKRFSFSIEGEGDRLIVAESAIDALSLATLKKMTGKGWKNLHYLSLGGASVKKNSPDLPPALSQYLHDHPQIRQVHLALDNDAAGRLAVERMLERFDERYEISFSFPDSCKDYNDLLCRKKQHKKAEHIR